MAEKSISINANTTRENEWLAPYLPESRVLRVVTPEMAPELAEWGRSGVRPSPILEGFFKTVPRGFFQMLRWVFPRVPFYLALGVGLRL